MDKTNILFHRVIIYFFFVFFELFNSLLSNNTDIGPRKLLWNTINLHFYFYRDFICFHVITVFAPIKSLGSIILDIFELDI